VGTYNLDPRSENLNTEVGVVIHDAAQAAAVAGAIDIDTLPANSWSAADAHDGSLERWRVVLEHIAAHERNRRATVR
jgi:phosphatidylserine/phosphatidylglycerophosphate/cardiolipin synthase-like enzyme